MRIPIGRAFRTKGAACTDLSRPGTPMIPATCKACSRVDVVIRSVGGLVIKLLTLGGCFSEALALEREAMSVVYQPIENSAGVRPMFDVRQREFIALSAARSTGVAFDAVQ